MEFNLRVSQENLNIIFSGLGELPSKMTYSLMKDLEFQIQLQLQAVQKQENSGEVKKEASASKNTEDVKKEENNG